MFLMMESLSKGKSGFLCVKCNKLKVGKESLQPEILFACIKLAFSYIFQQEKQTVYPFGDVEMEQFFFQRYDHMRTSTRSFYCALYLILFSCGVSGRLYSSAKMISALSE